MTNAVRKPTPPAPGFAEQAVAFTSFKALEKGIPAAWARSLESQGLTREDIRRIIPDCGLSTDIFSGFPFAYFSYYQHIRMFFLYNAYLRMATPGTW